MLSVKRRTEQVQWLVARVPSIVQTLGNWTELVLGIAGSFSSPQFKEKDLHSVQEKSL